MYKKGYDGKWKTELSELTTERDDAVKMLSDALKQNAEIERENVTLRKERDALKIAIGREIRFLENGGNNYAAAVHLDAVLQKAETALKEKK